MGKVSLCINRLIIRSAGCSSCQRRLCCSPDVRPAGFDDRRWQCRHERLEEEGRRRPPLPLPRLVPVSRHRHAPRSLGKGHFSNDARSAKTRSRSVVRLARCSDPGASGLVRYAPAPDLASSSSTATVASGSKRCKSCSMPSSRTAHPSVLARSTAGPISESA